MAGEGRTEPIIIGFRPTMKRHSSAPSPGRSGVGSTKEAAIQFAMLNVASLTLVGARMSTLTCPLAAAGRSFDSGNREGQLWHQRMRTFDPIRTFAYVSTERPLATYSGHSFERVGRSAQCRTKLGRSAWKLLTLGANAQRPRQRRIRGHGELGAAWLSMPDRY
jgi:hypothetical protein